MFLRQDKDCDGVIKSTNYTESGNRLGIFHICTVVLRTLKPNKMCGPDDLN